MLTKGIAVLEPAPHRDFLVQGTTSLREALETTLSTPGGVQDTIRTANTLFIDVDDCVMPKNDCRPYPGVITFLRKVSQHRTVFLTTNNPLRAKQLRDIFLRAGLLRKIKVYTPLSAINDFLLLERNHGQIKPLDNIWVCSNNDKLEISDHLDSQTRQHALDFMLVDEKGPIKKIIKNFKYVIFNPYPTLTFDQFKYLQLILRSVSQVKILTFASHRQLKDLLTAEPAQRKTKGLSHPDDFFQKLWVSGATRMYHFGKDQPLFWEMLLANHATPSTRALCIGDSPEYDLLSPFALGIPSILVTGKIAGHRPPEQKRSVAQANQLLGVPDNFLGAAPLLRVSSLLSLQSYFG